jgi:tagatose 1,6-diphosphate aldolase
LFRRFFSVRQVLAGAEIDLCLRERNTVDLSTGIRESFTYDICLPGSRTAMGYVSLRLGESPELYYLGHIGYRVEEGFRGHGYAGKAVAMLLPVMNRLCLRSVVITTDTDNIPSRVTCERLGCVLERVVTIPPRYRPLCMMSPAKCRYILQISETGPEGGRQA